MPYQKIPGTNTKWRPASEAFADPDYEWVPNAEGGFDGSKKGGFIENWMPWLVGGAFAYPAIAALAGLPTAGAAGGAAASSAPLGGVGIDTSIGGAVGVTGNPVVGAVPGAATAVPASVGGGNLVGAAASGAASGALGKLGNTAKNLLTSEGGVTSLASLLPMLMARNAGNGPSALNGPYSDQINDLLGMTSERARRTDPLHQMVTRLAEARMPKNSRG